MNSTSCSQPQKALFSWAMESRRDDDFSERGAAEEASLPIRRILGGSWTSTRATQYESGAPDSADVRAHEINFDWPLAILTRHWLCKLKSDEAQTLNACSKASGRACELASQFKNMCEMFAGCGEQAWRCKTMEKQRHGKLYWQLRAFFGAERTRSLTFLLALFAFTTNLHFGVSHEENPAGRASQNC